MRALPALAFVFVASVLSGCSTFAPVYGGNVGGDRNGAAMAFNFAPPDDRLEQIIINRLRIAFPGQASPSDPVLDIATAVTYPSGPLSNTVATARPINVRVEATMSIGDGQTVLFSATRFSDTAYQGGKLTPVDIASVTGAQETAANAVAEALRAAILAGYRPAPNVR